MFDDNGVTGMYDCIALCLCDVTNISGFSSYKLSEKGIQVFKQLKMVFIDV
jgi:hypothetical protein